MRKRLAGVIVVLIFSLSPSLFGQSSSRSDHLGEGSARKFNPHDLSGIWVWNSGFNLGAISKNMPPMTQWGKAKFDSNKPSFGPRAVAPSLGNDPLGICDPLGIPRELVETVYNRARFRFIQTPKQMLQLIMMNDDWREIWTDGRALPTDPDPRFMGYSVGKWEGDTFVVDSLGFDRRTWLDLLGDPHSDEMHLEERYQRIDADTLKLTFIVSDPKAYSQPIKSDVAVYKIDTDPQMPESFCVHSEEINFDNEIRNPAGGTHKP